MQLTLIDIIYFNFRNTFTFNNYLDKCAILVVINKNVIKINNLCFDCLRDNLKIRNNINQVQDFANVEKYNLEYFYNYNKTSLLSNILRLKIVA